MSTGRKEPSSSPGGRAAQPPGRSGLAPALPSSAGGATPSWPSRGHDAGRVATFHAHAATGG
eukprot:15165057-Alexandrium_andersonii.AAC.1